MQSQVEMMSLTKHSIGVALFVVLICSSTSAQATAPKSAARCNTAAADPVSFVSCLGHRFSSIATKDGCWLFVSVTSANPRSANGVAMLSRADGRVSLQKVFPVEASPTGMVIAHDDKLLIVADDEHGQGAGGFVSSRSRGRDRRKTRVGYQFKSLREGPDGAATLTVIDAARVSEVRRR